jgi:hypothetical protein
MLREERDAAWWQAVAEHPAVAPTVFLTGEVLSLAPALAREDITPLAAQHGGLWFERCGDEYELHAMFTPGGRPHEASAAFKLGYEEMIRRGAKRFHVSEVAGVPTSRPPLSHGWRCEGDFAPGPLNLSIRPWGLTVAEWRASPAYRRMA